MALDATSVDKIVAKPCVIPAKSVADVLPKIFKLLFCTDIFQENNAIPSLPVELPIKVTLPPPLVFVVPPKPLAATSDDVDLPIR